MSLSRLLPYASIGYPLVGAFAFAFARLVGECIEKV